MKIIKIKSIKEYKRLIADFYKNDSSFINNKNGLIDLVCRNQSAFYKLSRQEMIAVSNRGKIACICVLIQHKNDPDNLMIAFFECRNNSFDEVSLLIEYAAAFGKSLGCKNLIAALDGHCNNSVGFLSAGEGRPGFGQSYNPLFYNGIFKNLNFSTIKLVSYREDIFNLNIKLFDFAKNRLPQGLSIVCADFTRKGFNETMGRYTDICNKIFKSHRYCFHREYDEDYELFASMRPLLDNDNMLFAELNGDIVGFLFWYPDFNELVPSGGQAGIGTFIKYRILGKTPAAAKVVQIGVTPEYESKGLILALFDELYNVATKKHKGLQVFQSSWILEENQKSVKLSSKILSHPYKEMSVYEREI